ncbi:MAG: FAD-dependent oxidoreductase, partial [Planctomycetes bacterium]|nr:FAD-dependent oxidoreductase [Planctomycetota bacterium]
LRIQQTCMATGQAAGTATALSLAENVSPKELDVQALQDQLEIDRDVEPAFELLAELPLASR